jgi:hypothetical protein
MWEIYDGYYLPVGVSGKSSAGMSTRPLGVDVYALKQVAPGNPYTVFMSAYTRAKTRVAIGIMKNRDPDLQERNMQIYNKLRNVLAKVRESMPEPADQDNRHVVAVLKIEQIPNFQYIVRSVLDNYIDLGLDSYELFAVPDKLRIPRDIWCEAWRECVDALPSRMKPVVRDMPVKDYRKHMPRVIWWQFIQQWGATGVTADDNTTEECGAIEPQVITDHTVTDAVLQEKRVMHNTSMSAKLEFILEFDADTDVLAACIRLLPQKIGSIWVSDLSVRCNALVANVSLADMGEGYPIAESMNFDVLKRVAADVDDLHRRVTMLVKAVDAVRGGVDLS